MTSLAEILKNGRATSAMTTRQVSGRLHIDQALISKFENGLRTPTRSQVVQLSELFGLDQNEAILAWLVEKILAEIRDEPLAPEALKCVLSTFNVSAQQDDVAPQFQKLLEEMESLKSMLSKKP